MRWPSISITFHPKDLHLSPVFHRDESLHISEGSPPASSSSSGITFSVYESCWIKFLSMMAVRLSVLYLAPVIAASQTCPSSDSPSPSMVNMRCPEPSILAASADPMEKDRPIPSDPPQNSTPGHLRSGWPWSRLPNLRRVSTSATSKYPSTARLEKSPGAAWPFERTSLSLPSHSGFLGSCLRRLNRRTPTISAMENEPPGWPDPAAAVALIVSFRARFTFLCI